MLDAANELELGIAATKLPVSPGNQQLIFQLAQAYSTSRLAGKPAADTPATKTVRPPSSNSPSSWNAQPLIRHLQD